MMRQLIVVLTATLVVSSSNAEAHSRQPSSASTEVIHMAQAQLSSYPSLKLKLQASLDAVNAKLAEPNNSRFKRELDFSISKIDQLKSDYFKSRDRRYLRAFVGEYKKVKFNLKPLTDSLTPVMEMPLDVLETIREYEGPNLIVNWSEIDAMTADFTKMVMTLAEAENMMKTISENSNNYFNERLSAGDPPSISLSDEADIKAVEKYLNTK